MEARDPHHADDLWDIAAAVQRTPQYIERDRQHSEGAASRAATLAGEEALRKGKSKEEVAAVIESVGAAVCGFWHWKNSASILLVEAFLIGPRVERFGTPQEAADLQDIRLEASVWRRCLGGCGTGRAEVGGVWRGC